VIETCAGCGESEQHVDLYPYDVANESGVSSVSLCIECIKKLSVDRCGACGNRLPPSAEESVGPHGSCEKTRICDDCRRELIFGNGGVFQ
jgi:hypothetical protein